MERNDRSGLLVPLDGSDLAERAIPPAVALAIAGGLPITLIRAVADASTGAMDRDSRRRSEAAEAERYLAGVASRLAERGVIAVSDVQSGDAGEVVVRRAVEKRPELLVMATHGRSGLGRWVYGSVAESILGRCPVPVLLVRAAGPTARLEPASSHPRIVVPLDGSAFAEEAIPEALRLARLLGGLLVLVRAVPAMPAFSGIEPPMLPVAEPASLAQARAEAETCLGEMASRLTHDSVRCRTRIVDGEPADAILDVCQAENAALVVMATHGRSGLRRLIFGSIAAEVLHRSRAPILLVRPAAMAACPGFVGAPFAVPRAR